MSFDGLISLLISYRVFAVRVNFKFRDAMSLYNPCYYDYEIPIYLTLFLPFFTLYMFIILRSYIIFITFYCFKD